MMKKELTQAILHQLVLYHPTTGEFSQTDGSYFHTNVVRGYVRISLGEYGQHAAHRLSYLFMEGKWPENDVDHVDGNKSNNAWCNLRHATRSQNMQNKRAAHKSNATGLLGVREYNTTGKFEARIAFEHSQIHLGVFDTAEEAHEAYVKVKRELHPFGEL